jgi:hypothetical protein
LTENLEIDLHCKRYFFGRWIFLES